jgi:hypothetical protein
VKKAVDEGHRNCCPYPKESYTQICSSYRPWSHFIESSLDFVPQVLYWIQIRTEGRPWHGYDVVLLEKVPGDPGSVGAGIVLLEHVILVTAKIGHNVRSKDLIDISLSRDAITSAWANILKDHRSSFMVDADGTPNHDVSTSPRVSLHHACICVTFTSSSPDPYSAIRR